MSAFSGRADIAPTGYRIASCPNAEVMGTLTRCECESTKLPCVPPPENVRKISRLQSDEKRIGAPGRTRTNTSARKPDFESGASTNSATGARFSCGANKPDGRNRVNAPGSGAGSDSVPF